MNGQSENATASSSEPSGCRGCYGCLGVLITVVIIILAAITIIRRPSECDWHSGRMELEIGDMPALSRAHVLQSEELPNLSRIVRLDTSRAITDNFTMAFSPGDDQLAISGIGYISPVSAEAHLWKLSHSELCVLEVGDHSMVDNDSPMIVGYHNRFVAFSPDTRMVLLNMCQGGIGAGCFTLWSTTTNQLVGRYTNAAFVRHEDEWVFEYQEELTTPTRTSGQLWKTDKMVLSFIEPVIVDETNVKLIDRRTGNSLLNIVTSETVKDAEISHNGKLLALAVTQLDKYAPYLRHMYVELWGVVDATETTD